MSSKVPWSFVTAKNGMVQDPGVRAHPLVDVALEVDPDLGHVELLHGLHALERLTDVELRVLLRERVDVVERRVAVQDLERLPGLDAEDVRMVLAAALVDHDGSRRRRERAGGPLLDVDEDPLEGVVRVDDDLLRVRGRGVGRLAERVGVHLQFFHGRGRPLESDLAGDRGRAGDSGGGSRGRGAGGGGGRRRRFFFLVEQCVLVLAASAAEERDRDQESQEQEESALRH